MLMTLAVTAGAGVLPGVATAAKAAVKSSSKSRAKTESIEAKVELKDAPHINAGAALRRAKEISQSVIGESNATRLAHAKELLGKYYDRSVVSMEDQIADLNQFMKDRIQGKLTKQNVAKLSGKVYQAILDESSKHGFDPLFLMAVIENESSFNIKVRGTSGEIGLMQLMPDTGKWMAKRLGMKYEGAKTLEDPVQNIKLGAAYLAHLRERFDSHSRLYLAAYNMGQGNVDRALANQIWPKDYPILVMRRYIRFYTELTTAKRDDGKKLN